MVTGIATQALSPGPVGMHGRAKRLPETISQNARGVHGASGAEMTIQEVEFDLHIELRRRTELLFTRGVGNRRR